MASTTPTLDEEIESLQARVSSLKSQIRIQTSTLLAAPSTRQLLSTAGLTFPPEEDLAAPIRDKLLVRAEAQKAHTQQCLYRTCAGLTTFRTRDPDPNAVDGGAILGLRIEVVSRAKFLRPYYVFLNRPYSGSRAHLRAHRHTVPACIPLAALAVRHLPAPALAAASGEDGSEKTGKKQDLAKFARALRREVVRYHHRLGVVADLRKSVGLGSKEKITKAVEEGDEEEEEGPALADKLEGKLVGITAADAEAKQITIEWADGRTGRLVMGDDGEILKLVAVGEKGRDREAIRELAGDSVRVEDVVRRLAAA